MSRTYEFHGRVLHYPGAYVNTDFQGMESVGTDDTKIGGLIGLADKGMPGVLHAITSPKLGSEVFGVNSDIAKALRQIFDPTDPNNTVPDYSPPSLVYVYNAKPLKQSESYLTRKLATDITRDNSDSLTSKFVSEVTDALDVSGKQRAYFEFDEASAVDGKYSNMVVEVIAGPAKGQQRYIEESVAVSSGSKHRCFLKQGFDWQVKPLGSNSSKVRIVAPLARITHDEYGTVGKLSSWTFDNSTSRSGYEFTSRYNGLVETAAVPYGSIQTPKIHIKFDPTGGASLTSPADWIIGVDSTFGEQTTITTNSNETTIEVAAAAIAAANTLNQKWVICTGYASGATSAQQALVGNIYQIKENAKPSDNLIYLHGTGLGLDPDDKLKFRLLDIADFYFEVEGDTGASKTLTLKYRDNDGTIVTHGKAIDLTSVSSMTDLVTTLNEYPGVFAQLGDGVDGSAAPTTFDFGVTSNHYGTEQYGLLASNITTSATSVVLENAGYPAVLAGAEFPDSSSEANAFPFPIHVIEYTTAGAVTAQEIMVCTSRSSDTLTVTRSSNPQAFTAANRVEVRRLVNGENTTVKYNFGTQMIVAPDSTEKGAIFYDDLQQTIEYITTQVGRISAERVTAVNTNETLKKEIGAAMPQEKGGVFTSLHGGDPGTVSLLQQDATNADYPVSWEHGLTQLNLQSDIYAEVLLASDDDSDGFSSGNFLSLVDMFSTHLKDAEAARGERRGYIGAKLPFEAGTVGGVAYSLGLVELARRENEPRLSLCGQEPLVQLPTSEEYLPCWGMAAQMMGLELGLPIGEPLTLKRLSGTDYRSPLGDWDHRDVDIQRKANLNSVCIADDRSGVYKVVRGYTTSQSNNLGLTDINVQTIKNFLQRRYRSALEERFGGRGIGARRPGVRAVAPVSQASVREYMVLLLEQDRENGYIIDSRRNGEWLNAYTNPKVKIVQGDVVLIRVKVYPKTGANYILLDFDFQLPTVTG